MSDKPERQGYNESNVSQVADVGKTLIGGITPADKGWILGFIVVVGIIVGSDMWVSIKTLESNRVANAALVDYFIAVEQNRSEALERQAMQYGDQTRRHQEVIRALAESVARDSERAGDAALQAIGKQSDRQTVETITESKEFIGPPEASK